MKKTRKIHHAFALTALLGSMVLLSSCQETHITNIPPSSGSSSNNGPPSGGGHNNPPPGSGNPPGTGQGLTCFGDHRDGVGAGAFQLRSWKFKLAGKTSWMPWSTNGPTATALQKEFMPSAVVASDLFNSDLRLDVRVKIEPQPRPPQGEEYCFGRNFPQAQYEHDYTKVKFDLSLRDIQCTTGTNGQIVSCGLGARYATQTIGPIDINSCSNIYDLVPLRKFSAYGTTIEISNVRTDNACQKTGSNYDCAANAPLKSGSCWAGTIQVSTEFTKEFSR